MAQPALDVQQIEHPTGDRLVLRPSVMLVEGSDDLLIRYAHWELRLPQQPVDASNILTRLVTDRLVDEAPEPEVRGVIQLLSAQGCFLPAVPEQLGLRDLYRLLQPIRSELYAAYYAHPLWTRLREGSASTGEFAAWALHNYQISRSAGPIAARMAQQPIDGALREAFRADALEEYWHCDAFYFVKRGRLPLDPTRAKAYIPLPGVRAFEDVALRAAETDWLAHLIIAYFQESSIIFGDASERFYDDIERNYDLSGFFRGWRRHLALDRDHGHAEGLAALFDDDRIVSRAAVETSMRSLQLAHHYLVAALDQILEAPDEFEDAVEDRQPDRIAVARDYDETPIAALPLAFWPYLRSKLEDAAFSALAQSRGHDEIMAAGILAAVLHNAVRPVSDLDNPWLAALGNFVVEQAGDLRILLSLATDLLAACEMMPLGREAQAKLASAQTALGPARTPDLSVARFQMRELTALARTSAALEPMIVGVPMETETA